MQRKEQRVVLLESPPDQDQYIEAQPKRKTTSRRSGFKLSKEPRRSQGQRQPRRHPVNHGTLDNEDMTATRTRMSRRRASTPSIGHLVPTSGNVDGIPSTTLRKTPQGRKMWHCAANLTTSESEDDDQMSVACDRATPVCLVRIHRQWQDAGLREQSTRSTLLSKITTRECGQLTDYWLVTPQTRLKYSVQSGYLFRATSKPMRGML